MHADDEDEREQDGCDDRRELAQRQHADQHAGQGEHDDETTRHHPAPVSDVGRTTHTATLPERATDRFARNG
ncbi:hypothetical protein GCM10023320_59850 [Pseudonocardia adelaidensis]|uniref:Uncharacterized protein n=1 Tax=Pseudonocardia adelaidensis TaxID=648754 RepID=A0ABP9NTB6_9PSEU